MNSKNFILFVPLIIALIMGCHKIYMHPANTSISGDVYVVGETKVGTGAVVATIWKNGVPTFLSDSTSSVSFATSIAIYSGDVYIAGSFGNTLAVYWKNGKMDTLGYFTGGASANAIMVNSDGIFMTGYTDTHNAAEVALWKNGVLQNFKVDTLTSSYGYAITMNGNDTYIVGGAFNYQNYYSTSALWENGSLTSLPSLSTSNNVVKAIVISNDNIYTGGESVDTVKKIQEPVIWKNGVIHTLPGTLSRGIVNAIAILDNDLYAAGQSDNNAVYWKNGTSTVLATGTTDVPANISGIATLGEDVYMSGSSAGQAVYWENGKMTVLGKGTASAIIVVPHK